MRKVIAVLIVLAATVSVISIMGAGEYKEIRGRQRFIVVGDTSAGSTIATGELNLSAGIGNALCEGYDAMYGKIVMSGPNPAVAGFGNDDTGWVWLRTVFGGDEILLDSVVQEGLPCTLRYVLPAAAGTDTVLKNYLLIDWQLYDSISDTTASANYDFEWDITLK